MVAGGPSALEREAIAEQGIKRVSAKPGKGTGGRPAKGWWAGAGAGMGQPELPWGWLLSCWGSLLVGARPCREAKGAVRAWWQMREKDPGLLSSPPCFYGSVSRRSGGPRAWPGAACDAYVWSAEVGDGRPPSHSNIVSVCSLAHSGWTDGPLRPAASPACFPPPSLLSARRVGR